LVAVEQVETLLQQQVVLMELHQLLEPYLPLMAGAVEHHQVLALLVGLQTLEQAQAVADLTMQALEPSAGVAVGLCHQCHSQFLEYRQLKAVSVVVELLAAQQQ
jgi:hypothetical protein